MHLCPTQTSRMNYSDPSNDWQRKDPYTYVHPGGWRIANQLVTGRPRWVLSCGGTPFGNFPTPEAAMEHHARLWKGDGEGF